MHFIWLAVSVGRKSVGFPSILTSHAARVCESWCMRSSICGLVNILPCHRKQNPPFSFVLLLWQNFWLQWCHAWTKFGDAVFTHVQIPDNVSKQHNELSPHRDLNTLKQEFTCATSPFICSVSSQKSKSNLKGHVSFYDLEVLQWMQEVLMGGKDSEHVICTVTENAESEFGIWHLTKS